MVDKAWITDSDPTQLDAYSESFNSDFSALILDCDFEWVFQGQRHKLIAYESLRAELSLEPEQIAFVGDDLLDLPLMRRVGLSIAVADAHPAILPFAHWVTGNRGGEGAGREVCDLVMDAQGHLNRMIESHF